MRDRTKYLHQGLANGLILEKAAWCEVEICFIKHMKCNSYSVRLMLLYVFFLIYLNSVVNISLIQDKYKLTACS